MFRLAPAMTDVEETVKLAAGATRSGASSVKVRGPWESTLLPSASWVALYS